MWEEQSLSARSGELPSSSLRYYADARLVHLVQQYSEVNEERARQVISDVVGACLRQWDGQFHAGADPDPIQCQKFWLCGPERTMSLWIRFNASYCDVIAKLEEA